MKRLYAYKGVITTPGTTDVPDVPLKGIIKIKAKSKIKALRKLGKWIAKKKHVEIERVGKLKIKRVPSI